MSCPQWGVERVAEEDALWYESPDEVARKVEEAGHRAVTIQRVWATARKACSERQYLYLRSVFHDGTTYHSAAKRFGRNPSTILRQCRKAIVKIREELKRGGLCEAC